MVSSVHWLAQGWAVVRKTGHDVEAAPTPASIAKGSRKGSSCFSAAAKEQNRWKLAFVGI